MAETLQITELTPDLLLKYGICGYKDPRRPGFMEKVEWVRANLEHGLRIFGLISETDGLQGMIEFIPGEHAWRPVEARNYMVIHCLFVGFKKVYKGRGSASRLIQVCEEETAKLKLDGVAAVTRNGSFMVSKPVFLKAGYRVTDTVEPDFELLVKKINSDKPDPQFRTGSIDHHREYKNGLTIIRADQCPNTVKNVREISETAQKEFGLTPNIVDLSTAEAAQNSPCPYGVFCSVYDGQVVAEHPISNSRFRNIMNTIRDKRN